LGDRATINHRHIAATALQASAGAQQQQIAVTRHGVRTLTRHAPQRPAVRSIRPHRTDYCTINIRLMQQKAL
jgi:hypothetical protein